MVTTDVGKVAMEAVERGGGREEGEEAGGEARRGAEDGG